MTYQQITIIGNLGSDPEMKQLPSGTPVTNFNVAVNEKWRDRQSNEMREKTTWFRVAVYGGQAETTARYLSKGRQVMVVGTIEARAYINNAGEAAASLELRARDVRFLQGGDAMSGGGGDYGRSASGSGRGSGGDYDNDYGGDYASNESEIPF